MLQAARAQLAAARAQLVEARNNYTRMSDLVREDAVSRAQYDQAEALLKTAEAQVEVGAVAGRPGAEPAELHATGVRCGRRGDRARTEPGEVVSAGRMIIQVAREGARDAVFDVPAQVKDSAPTNPEITVALTSDPTGHGQRAACAKCRRAPTR